MVNHSIRFTAERLPFASREASVEAVEALATAVPVGRALNTGAEENVFTAVIVSVLSRYIASPSEIAVFNCAFVNEPRSVAFPVEVTCPVRFAFVVTVPAFPVTLPAIAFVTCKSVNHPFTIRFPVTPICHEASVARSDAEAHGLLLEVIA